MNELEKKFRLDLDEKAQSFLDDQNAIYFRNGANWAFQWFSRQQWVSVKERLPEYMQTCIIHCDVGFVTMAQYAGHKECFKIGDDHYIATAWMPLPEPPK